MSEEAPKKTVKKVVRKVSKKTIAVKTSTPDALADIAAPAIAEATNSLEVHITPVQPSTPARPPIEAANDYEPQAEPMREPETVGGFESASQRKNRRRRKKKNNASAFSNETDQPLDLAAPAPQPSTTTHQQPLIHSQTAGNQHQPTHQQQHRQSLDRELITKRAWKIFLAEVSEEGLALISDQDAREISRRCFRIAELFTEEQTKRRF